MEAAPAVAMQENLPATAPANAADTLRKLRLFMTLPRFA
jgi:hypothetical protein